ncbi:MAG: hypothetical protein ACT4N4_10000 [Rhodospirillales bacterium]
MNAMPSASPVATSNDLSGAIDGSPGYWAGTLMPASELKQVRGLIHRQFLDRIAKLSPAAVDAFSQIGMERYHLRSHLIDHADVWPRPVRLFPADGIEFIRRSILMRRIAEIFGPAELTNEVEAGPPEIVWRIVRPGEKDDVGPLHADAWFWDIHGWPVPPGHKRIKVWTMVHGEAGRAGMRIVPDSHLKARWKYRVEQRHGMLKPVFDESAVASRSELLHTPPGASVLFNYGLLHGGSVTGGDICRVSFEFTVFVPAR